MSAADDYPWLARIVKVAPPDAPRTREARRALAEIDALRAVIKSATPVTSPPTVEPPGRGGSQPAAPSPAPTERGEA